MYSGNALPRHWRSLSSYLPGVLVHCNVDDAVVVTALFQDGLLDDLVPVLAHLPVESRHGERDRNNIERKRERGRE